MVVSSSQFVINNDKIADVISSQQKNSLDSFFVLTGTKFSPSFSNRFFADTDGKPVEVSPELISGFKAQYNTQDSTLFAEGIIAHEYGHLKQHFLNKSWEKDKIVAKKELHADFLAGWYLSKKYRSLFIPIVNPQSISDNVCLFFQKRNQRINSIISILINSNYEYDYSLEFFGFTSDKFKLMRFSAVWRGLASSDISNIKDAYSVGDKEIEQFLNNQDTFKTYKYFEAIGLPLITDILKGKFGFSQSINAIRDKILSSKLKLTDLAKSLIILKAVEDKPCEQ